MNIYKALLVLNLLLAEKAKAADSIVQIKSSEDGQVQNLKEDTKHNLIEKSK